MENKAAREEFKFKDDSEEEEENLLGKESELDKMRAALKASKLNTISNLSFRFTRCEYVVANFAIEPEKRLTEDGNGKRRCDSTSNISWWVNIKYGRYRHWGL